jgi:hypothetical protein
MDRFHAHRPVDTLGAATYLAASSIHIAREDDDVSSICVAVGASPLRSAAWLRSRGAAVGHAATRSRLTSLEGAAYELASRTVISRSSHKTAVTLAEIRSRQIAAWLALDRVAIILVGSAWPTCQGNDIHALVVVAAEARSLSVFDPAGEGVVQNVSFQDLDALRAEPTAAWEVLVVTRRR